MLSTKQAEILLEHIIKYSFDEIFVTDTAGYVQMASSSFRNLFGIHAEEIINQNGFELEQKGILSPSVTGKVLKTKKIETIVQETGLGRKLVVSAYPVIDGNGKLMGAISFSRDITELVYLRKTNDQVAKTIQLYEIELEKLKIKQFQKRGSNNEQMKNVFSIVNKVSSLDVTVLLGGESGVGKNYIAQTIHQISDRKDEAFIEVNCGAIPESLIESELFGYEEGAFTGAKKSGKIGYFEAAGNGTIFLDEIAELPLNLQVKLLSVLQNRTIQRVGGNTIKKLNCRIICATNQNLPELIREKKFREDLYYRINVVKIIIPPLRNRREDMIPLIYDLVDEFNEKYKMKKSFSMHMISWISKQDWPGNIRELRNFIERIMITSNENVIDADQTDQQKKIEEDMTLDEFMEMAERDFIRKMYEHYPSSVKLAKKLGISQSKASRKIRQHVQKPSQK
ncbi:sigma 54-interacting transcriptional regulator [Bacillus sp. FJAT-49705]|uniref:HTH-type transcriptional regulatory protein TyrR n=1 Tax=Cytobacillus citreus TaxID=2833586 RepID=A0ABS5NWS8_9BACI|nr:sigma 54-interacting transcriptional regulator [Cytobacillus citreus]MBS4192232.1 sigma 54-interacting transcriptional regulator [Cytobacillus citreus]